MSRAYAELVHDVRELPADQRRDLKFLIERSLVEERRQEIADNYRQSLQELEEGSLAASSDVGTLRADLES